MKPRELFSICCVRCCCLVSAHSIAPGLCTQGHCNTCMHNNSCHKWRPFPDLCCLPAYCCCSVIWRFTARLIQYDYNVLNWQDLWVSKQSRSGCNFANNTLIVPGTGGIPYVLSWSGVSSLCASFKFQFESRSED